MTIDSPYWDLREGVCTKHNVPETPCPACLAGNGDDDLTVTFSETDRTVAEFDGISLLEFVPANLVEVIKSGRIQMF
jgi:hypothetical protein